MTLGATDSVTPGVTAMGNTTQDANQPLMLATSDDLKERGLLMATSKDLIDLQCAENKRSEDERKQLEFSNLTFAGVLGEIGATFQGCLTDVINKRDLSLSNMFLTPERLRGWGFALVIFAILGLVMLGALQL